MIHVLGYVAVTFIIVRSGIFRWLREVGPKGWRDFVSCPLCTGFWVGAVLHCVDHLDILMISHSWPQALNALGAVEVGALTGLTALVVACVVDWLDASEQLAREKKP